MMQRIRKSMAQKEQGFTLIELLVVIIIIGILAAIAIPVFLNQRKKGVDAGIKADLKNAATTVESYATDFPSAAIPAGAVTSAGVVTGAALNGFKGTSGNVLTLTPSTGTTGGYCIFAFNAGASTANDLTHQLQYSSQNGGLSTTIAAATTCA